MKMAGVTAMLLAAAGTFNPVLFHESADILRASHYIGPSRGRRTALRMVPDMLTRWLDPGSEKQSLPDRRRPVKGWTTPGDRCNQVGESRATLPSLGGSL